MSTGHIETKRLQRSWSLWTDLSISIEYVVENGLLIVWKRTCTEEEKKRSEMMLFIVLNTGSDGDIEELEPS